MNKFLIRIEYLKELQCDLQQFRFTMAYVTGKYTIPMKNAVDKARKWIKIEVPKDKNPVDFYIAKLEKEINSMYCVIN